MNYVILDKSMKRVATIDPTADNNYFWGDELSQQIADDNSNSDDISGVDTFNSTDPNANSKNWNDTLDGLTMLQSEPAAQYLREGNYIAKYDSTTDRWRVYRIHTVTEPEDQVSGAHLITVSAINAAIWKLGKTIPAKKELKQGKLKDAMSWIMADTGWSLVNNASSGIFADISFDGSSTSQAMLQTVLSTFDCEADAYVHMDQWGLVDDQILELSDRLGENTGRRIRYGDNALTMQRETVDTTLVTKLYVYGSDDKSISGVNKGRNYLSDSKNNALYNADPNTWLEGSITSSTIKEPNALLAWGMKQLKLYNHPRVNYVVEPTSDFNPNLGDTVKVIDLDMIPQLTVQARVIQTTTSLSDPAKNKIVLGEFATVNVVTPNFIKNMEQRWNDQVKKLFEDARKNSTAASISLITPLGQSWANGDTSKRIIGRLFIEGVNVTGFLSAAAWNWQRINADGTHDLDWEAAHSDDGYEVTITPPFVGTLMVSVDDAFVKDEAEMWIDTGKSKDGSFKKRWETTYGNLDEWGNSHVGALQDAFIMKNGEVLTSYAYNAKPNKSSQSDCQFLHWDANGKLLNSMIVQGGQHGGAFSYDENSNTIYSQIKDLSGGQNWLCTFPFTPHAVINSGSGGVVKWCKVSSYYRPCVDLEHELWMGSKTDGSVDICQISDLKAGNFKPVIEFKVQDVGWNPLPTGSTNDGTFNTMQSNALYYPYAFFTAGDVNNADDRLVMCVNVITHSMIFNYAVTEGQDIDLNIPMENGGHMEPEGVYYDATNSKLIVGFNVSEYRNGAKTEAIAHTALYEFPVGWRDDSKDLAVEYPAEDISEGSEDVHIITQPSTDIEDDASMTDDDSDFNIDDPMVTKEVTE
ncbi:phage tail spike protein [Levilactobacillus brevis]